MSTNTIKTTLIISTYNWVEALELVFISLLSQTKKPFEVIIADDGSDERTKELINNYKSKFSCPLIHLWQEDKGFEKSKILNKAIKKSSGNYIIQIDGDVMLHKRFIEDHINNSKKGMFISGTRVLLGEKISKELLKNKMIRLNFFTKDITNKHYTLRIPQLTGFLKKPSKDNQKVILSVRGCNMSFWKNDLLEVNGYEENMTGWGREDSEISARLINIGVKKINLKFSGIQYHIFHPSLPKDRLNINDVILQNTVNKNLKYAVNGIKKGKKESNCDRQKISAIIPTLNEEKNIEEAIATLDFADEIIVIDSFSNDATVELAKKNGAKVIQRKFDDFSSQKNYAISKAENEWIFILDADERPSDDLREEIINTTKNKPASDAYWIYRQNYFAGKRIRYSGWQNDKVMRLFDRRNAKYDGRLVHEEIKNEGRSSHLKGKLLHYSCENEYIFKKKILRYSRLKAKELFKEKVKPNLYHYYIKPAYRFIYHYILKFGFLDGKIGLTIASINASGTANRYKELKKLYN